MAFLLSVSLNRARALTHALHTLNFHVFACLGDNQRLLKITHTKNHIQTANFVKCRHAVIMMTKSQVLGTTEKRFSLTTSNEVKREKKTVTINILAFFDCVLLMLDLMWSISSFLPRNAFSVLWSKHLFPFPSILSDVTRISPLLFLIRSFFFFLLFLHNRHIETSHGG